MRGLITAIRTLTVLPLPGKDAERYSSALYFFPLVGGLIGLVVYGAVRLVADGLHWPLGAGVACVAVSALISGGLHLDGLADVFDSMGGRTRERKLEIMKDPRIGSFGVIALVIVLLAKFGAAIELVNPDKYWLFVLPYVISRTLQVAFVVCLPYARREGTAQPFVEGARAIHLIVALIIGAALCFLVARWMGLVFLGVSMVPLAGLILWMRKVYGGVTGDLIGMGSEMIEIFVFICLVVHL